MKKVFKYKLLFTDIAEVELPIGAQILTIDEQNKSLENPSEENHLFIWAIVDDEEKRTETRRFRISGTGHPLGDFNFKYINTIPIYNGYEVYHVLEILDEK